MFHSENIYVDLLMATMLPFKESAKETEKDTEFKHTLTNKGSNQDQKGFTSLMSLEDFFSFNKELVILHFFRKSMWCFIELKYGK